MPEPPQENEPEKKIFLYAEFITAESSWFDGFYNAENQILITDSVSESKAVLTLDERSDGVFRLSGAVTKYPDEAWCSDDGIQATFVFTFEPAGEATATLEPESLPDPVPTPEPAGSPEPEQTLKASPAPEETPGPAITETPAPVPEEAPGPAAEESPAPEQTSVPENTPEPDSSELPSENTESGEAAR